MIDSDTRRHDLKRNKQEAYQWGLDAEELAYKHLIEHGYTVRERRWRQGASKSDVDIIAELPGIIVFIEVKARSPYEDDEQQEWRNDPTSPAEAVDLKKRRLMARTADRYLRVQERDYDYRYDIITIVGTPSDHLLTHIPDAFISPVSSR